MTFEDKMYELHRKAHNVAFSWYIRKGYVPSLLPEIMAATTSLEAFLKYSPDQPRVPAGNPDGGQWTSGGDDGADTIDDPPIQPVYPIETLILTFLPVGRLLSAWRVVAEEATADAEWTLGAFKSAQRWANQIANRNWTPEEISDTVANGEQFPAPNKVNPGNTATRYENPATGRFVVRDDITKEILQISDDGFAPNELPQK